MIAVESSYDSSRKFVCLLSNVRMSCSECSYAFFRIHVLPPLESRKKQKKTCEMKKISENICRIQKKAVILHSEIKTVSMPMWCFAPHHHDITWFRSAERHSEIKTVYDTSLVISGSLAQLNRASDYGSEGCRFESCRSHNQSVFIEQDTQRIGSLAQLNRASDYGSEGCRFESCTNHKKLNEAYWSKGTFDW